MKKKQYIVIDGLARSGTTLLHSVLNSQENFISLRGCFVEPLATSYSGSIWPFASWPWNKLSSKFISTKEVRFKGHSFLNKYFDTKKFKKATLDSIKRREQFQHFNQDSWRCFFNKNLNSFNDIDHLYYDILEKSRNEILFFRWNNCISYLNVWTDRINHKWVTVVRHPESRAISYKKSHNVSFQKSLKYSIAFAKKVDSILNNDKVLVIYYEDLISNPEDIIDDIFKFLNINQEINLSNIINSDAKPYRNETSDLVDLNKNRLAGKEFEGFIMPKIYSENLGFKDYLKDFQIYKRYY